MHTEHRSSRRTQAKQFHQRTARNVQRHGLNRGVDRQRRAVVGAQRESREVGAIGIQIVLVIAVDVDSDLDLPDQLQQIRAVCLTRPAPKMVYGASGRSPSRLAMTPPPSWSMPRPPEGNATSLPSVSRSRNSLREPNPVPNGVDGQGGYAVRGSDGSMPQSEVVLVLGTCMGQDHHRPTRRRLLPDGEISVQ